MGTEIPSVPPVLQNNLPLAEKVAQLSQKLAELEQHDFLLLFSLAQQHSPLLLSPG